MLRVLSSHWTRLLVLCGLISFVSFPQTLHPQFISRAIVKGRVLDDSTRAPLPFTNVFVSNSTIGAATDAAGKFELKGVPLGTQEFVASLVGYAPQTIVLRLRDTTVYEMEFRLKPQAIQIPGVMVEAKEPKEWKQNLQKFTGLFLGSTSNAAQCTMLNPEVLDFKADAETEQFTATAREPVIIENRAFGYRIEYFLDFFTERWRSFEFSPTWKSIEFIGRTRFTPLHPQNENEMKQWENNRRKAYYGSERHFLTALVQKSSQKEGFEVYSIMVGRLEDAIESRRGYRVDADTLLTPGEFWFERKLSFQGLLQIVYDRGGASQISVIKLDRPPVVVYTNGLLVDPLGITTFGTWASHRTAEMLPTDYTPEEK